MKHYSVPRLVSKLLLPMILLFAFYVQFHGEYGPGGGFQAGVIFAAGIILYGLIYGVDSARRLIPQGGLRIGMASGVLLYSGVGFLTMLLGGNYLDYSVLSHDPVHGQELGIFLVELGVGVTVASVMIMIFIAFAGRES